MEEANAKAALEARRAERERMNERMRNPNAAPPEPRKQILKKGAKVAVTKINTPPDPRVEARRREVEAERRQWREGLKEHIQQARHQAKV